MCIKANSQKMNIVDSASETEKHENLSDNEIENWSCSSLHPSNSNNEFRQPFSIKVYDNF